MQSVLCSCVLPLLTGREERSCLLLGEVPRQAVLRRLGKGEILPEAVEESWVCTVRFWIVWSGEGLGVLSERWNPEFLPREGCRFCSGICNVAGCILEEGNCSLLPAHKSQSFSGKPYSLHYSLCWLGWTTETPESPWEGKVCRSDWGLCTSGILLRHDRLDKQFLLSFPGFNYLEMVCLLLFPQCI